MPFVSSILVPKPSPTSFASCFRLRGTHPGYGLHRKIPRPGSVGRPVASSSFAPIRPCRRRGGADPPFIAGASGAQSSSNPPARNFVKARWSIDAKYGKKGEAIQLMKEWVLNIASVAGVDASQVSLCSGAVGAPESRIELEVEFPNLGGWESFLSRIPAVEHRTWSGHMEKCIIHGSPTWSVFYLANILESNQKSTSTTESSDSKPSSTSAGLIIPEVSSVERLKSSKDFDSLLANALQKNASEKEIQPSEEADKGTEGSAAEDLDEDDSSINVTDLEQNLPPGHRIVTDWKGDPMIVKPGDNLPL